MTPQIPLLRPSLLSYQQCARASPFSLLFTPILISALHIPLHIKRASSTSRWKARQTRDPYAREAKVQGLKSRAAFKLLEMDEKYRIFKKGQTVVDLGFAPGSWSQVALHRTRPHGSVLGIDILPAQPPSGVSSIQGNFLSPAVREVVKDFLRDAHSRKKSEGPLVSMDGRGQAQGDDGAVEGEGGEVEVQLQPSYIDREKSGLQGASSDESDGGPTTDRLVDVVLSDMSAPWPQSDFRKSGMNNPYYRLMNTSGVAFRDHVGSIDLCYSALTFASDTLRPGGHFLCKFYQGSEDKMLEQRLKRMFDKVFREKPDSSRKESKEGYFVALRRKRDVVDEEIV